MRTFHKAPRLPANQRGQEALSRGVWPASPTARHVTQEVPISSLLRTWKATSQETTSALVNSTLASEPHLTF